MAEGDGAKESATESAPSHFIRNIVSRGYKERQESGPGAHAVSAGAERLSAHRPCQVDLPQFRSWPPNSPASAICASTIPIQARKRLNTSIRSNKTCVGWGLTWDGEFYASDYFEQLYEFAISIDSKPARRLFAISALSKCANTAAH